MPSDLLSLALASLQFLSFKEKIILQKKLDNITDLAVLSIDEMSFLIGRKVRSRSWNGKAVLKQVEQSAALLNAFNIGFVLHEDAAYPALVREIYDPPFMLFYRGDISVAGCPCVSVVGTRHPSSGGMKNAVAFAREAATDGCTVVSGLAFGIDSGAHRGAVSVAGRSIGVLPCGADAVFPVANRNLARAVLDNGGCLLSEYLPGTLPAKFRFPQRNRIISALSPVTVVVEAPPGSGALITADFALEQGRDVYIHAGSAQEPDSSRSGTSGYIRDGAPVISSYEDFCLCRSSAPGMLYCKQDKQLLL